MSKKKKIKIGKVNMRVEVGYLNRKEEITNTYNVKIKKEFDKHYMVEFGRLLKGRYTYISEPLILEKAVVYDIEKKRLKWYDDLF